MMHMNYRPHVYVLFRNKTPAPTKPDHDMYSIDRPESSYQNNMQCSLARTLERKMVPLEGPVFRLVLRNRGQNALGLGIFDSMLLHHLPALNGHICD